MKFLIAISAALIPFVIILGVLGVIIWLIVKRVQEKENETFEKRDN
jgi:heme/copper-type cytochrome/quinol oxidase subunit 2